MADKESSDDPSRMTLGELRDAISRGTRLCSNCLPVRNEGMEGASFWDVCLARLPRSVKKVETELKWDSVASRSGPEHRHVRVPDDPDARDYFEKLPRGDPGAYHSTRDMIFIRLDIAKFTQFPEELQPRVLSELHEVVHRELQVPMFEGAEKSKEPERVLHTGDGFVLAFEMPSGDLRPWPLELSQRIARALDLRNDRAMPIHFRIAVTLGPVYVTGDLKGQVNYVGEAITETDRLLQCIPAAQDDVVCFSDRVYRKYRDKLSSMSFFRMGSVSDKHQMMHRLYLLEYTD